MKIGSDRASRLMEHSPAMDSYYERSEAMTQLVGAVRTGWMIVETYCRKILLGIVVALALGLIYLLFRTPVYEATTSLLIRTDNSRIVPFEDASVSLRGQADSQGFGTEIQFLASREVGLRVVENLNLTEHPLFSETSLTGGAASAHYAWFEPKYWVDLARSVFNGMSPSSPKPTWSTPEAGAAAAKVVPNSQLEFALNKYFDGISVQPIRNSRILRITFRSTDSVIAAMLVNAAADAYLEAEFELRSAANRDATAGLNAQLEALRTRLAQSESELAQFREQHNLPVFNSDNQRPLQIQITDLSRQLLTASIATSEAQERLNRARLISSQRSQVAALAGASPAIEFARQKLAIAEQEFKVVTSGYGKAHPNYQNALSQLNASRSSLKQEVGAEAARLDQALQSASREENALRAARQALIQAEQQAGRFNNERAYLEQNAEINRQLYQTFLSRTREVGAANDVQAPSANVLDRAIAATVPMGPGWSFVLAFFGFSGALISFTWAYVRHHLNRSIRTVEQAAHDLGQFVLAALPKIPPELSRSRGKLVRSAPTLDYCESIRLVAATIEFERPEEGAQSIAIASVDSLPGKTTFVTNLGIALSESRRVLIIDADTSGGNLQQLMGLRTIKPGLLDVLSDGSRASDAIHRARGGHLSVMTIGGGGVGVPALVRLSGLRHLVHKMEQHFEVVLVNAPPMNFSADSLVVSGACQQTLILVESQVRSLEAVRHAVMRLSRVRAKLLGIVLDGCPAETSSSPLSHSDSARVTLSYP